MAAVAEQEKQKITIPEIRDYADDSSSIDVDIDNMVWEVDTEPAAEENDDAYGREMRDAYDSRYDGSGSARSMADASYDSYDEINAGTGDYYSENDDTEAYYDGRPGEYIYEQVPYSRKMNKHIFTWLFSFVCGIYGVDRFVRGQIPLGVFKLLTFGGFGIWYLADVGIAIYKSYLAPDAMDHEDLHFDHWGRYV